MGAAAVAIMIRREKDIVRIFEEAGALGAATAKPLGALGLEETRHFGHLRKDGVIRQGEPGTWFLDRSAWDARQQRRRRAGLVLLAVILFAFALGLGLLPSGPR